MHNTYISDTMQKKEEVLKSQVSQYLALQYPDVIFRFDIAADIHLPDKLLWKSNRIHRHKKGYPDLFIAEPRGQYSGLFLELKYDKWQVLKKRGGGMKKSEHLESQKNMLARLNKKGYLADWGLGFDDTIKKIDKYLKLTK